MAKYAGELDDVFAALADPTRRRVVSALGAADASVSALAAGASMTLPSFLKHVRALERSGIIRTTKVGRVRMCSLRRDRLTAAGDWLDEQQRIWGERTDRLEALVTRMEKEPS
ncbi:transcriptional regulator [Pseudoclavibacter endophyticus]|uniref:Helix-turn-helix transcriptional regulator n=1 Tax=Pseudoclavibacter endophyticus TaxID=1778590 RepID=A0A6H9WTZ7_9MICO|nr:metalloregulator ArsR/SmtB family transcription factor [Pseudoclavibacter endophyticus]KAB1649730.1 helix-turn-helix transcriptional regulator [Pseudoclavibacter endophyticus]GGA60204.1 transcriptional regulator [Pseudoclavibacter endophyticus]